MGTNDCVLSLLTLTSKQKWKPLNCESNCSNMCLSDYTAMLPYSAMTTSLHTYAHTYFTLLSTRSLWKVNPTHLPNWPKKQRRQIPHKRNELLLVSSLRSHICPYINNDYCWNQHGCRNCKNIRPHATVRWNLWGVVDPSAL